jgi:hypothetical protein
MLGRRDFLKASTVVGVSAGAAGCAGRNEGLLVVPGEALSVQNMEAYLARLDGSMHAISTHDSPIPKLFPEVKLDKSDPVIKNGEELLRKNVRSLMLVGSFHDLPEEGRAYPGMQNRLVKGMNEMDEAMIGMHNAIKALTPTERVEIGRALKADPNLAMSIVGALDAEAAQSGISMERRLHLRSLAAQACARIKQSPGMFIDEYVAKTEKIMNRPVDPEEIQRRLLATIGENEYFALRDRSDRYFERWQVAQSSDPAAAEGSWIQKPNNTKIERANTLLTVGGVLLGLGILVGVVAVMLISSGSSAAIPGMFVATAGALLAIGGIVCLIIGAVLRSRAS